MVNAMAGVLSWCPGAEWVDSGSGQCYAVFTQSSSFSDAVEAQQLCHNSSSELASIPDSVAESIVLELLRNVTVCENRCVVEKYCDEYVSVCLSVCLCVCPRGYLQNHTRDLCQIFVHVAYGRGSVLLRRRCDTLCTSGFVDDIMFIFYNGRIAV